MKYNYYYPDSVAEFQDYGNDCDFDPFNDLKDTDNPVDLIDDINEEDFIMDKKDKIFTTDWWMPCEENQFSYSYFNQQNSINVFEYLNTNLDNQNQMIERLERIEKKLDTLINKENDNEKL